jgi:hypothetical protein
MGNSIAYMRSMDRRRNQLSPADPAVGQNKVLRAIEVFVASAIRIRDRD